MKIWVKIKLNYYLVHSVVEGVMMVNAQTFNCSVNCVECGVFMKRNFKGHKRVEEVLRELMAKDWNRRIYEQN